MVIYTERATINEGDRVLIGATSAADPVAASAEEVKAVTRYSDTFEQARDDYEVVT